MKLRSVFAVSLLFAAGSAAAYDHLEGQWNKQEFETHRASISAGLASHDGTYSELSDADEKKVLETLDRMEIRWKTAGDSGALSSTEQVAMANDQESVVVILGHASSDSRMVCEREAVLGSNLPKNVCKTVAQRRREMEESQEAMRTQQNDSRNIPPTQH